jgi:hypothetical protein
MTTTKETSMKHLFLAGLIVLGLAATAQAQTDYQAHFGNLDTNGDGKMDMSEYAGHFPQGDPGFFTEADADKDGALDHDEWHDFKEKHAAGGAGHGHGAGHADDGKSQ